MYTYIYLFFYTMLTHIIQADRSRTTPCSAAYRRRCKRSGRSQVKFSRRPQTRIHRPITIHLVVHATITQHSSQFYQLLSYNCQDSRLQQDPDVAAISPAICLRRHLRYHQLLALRQDQRALVSCRLASSLLQYRFHHLCCHSQCRSTIHSNFHDDVGIWQFRVYLILGIIDPTTSIVETCSCLCCRQCWQQPREYLRKLFRPSVTGTTILAGQCRQCGNFGSLYRTCHYASILSKLEEQST